MKPESIEKGVEQYQIGDLEDYALTPGVGIDIQPLHKYILVMPEELNEKILPSGIILTAQAQIDNNLGNPKIATVLAIGGEVTTVKPAQNILIEPHIGLEATIEIYGEMKVCSFIEEKHVIGILEA